MSDTDVVFDQGALAELLAGPTGPVAKDLLRRAINVETAAKRWAPVDTGRLRSSISHEMGTDDQGLFALVGSDVDYAIYQELGTRYMAAQPFLRPALAEVL